MFQTNNFFDSIKYFSWVYVLFGSPSETFLWPYSNAQIWFKEMFFESKKLFSVCKTPNIVFVESSDIRPSSYYMYKPYGKHLVHFFGSRNFLPFFACKSGHSHRIRDRSSWRTLKNAKKGEFLWLAWRSRWIRCRGRAREYAGLDRKTIVDQGLWLNRGRRGSDVGIGGKKGSLDAGPTAGSSGGDC